MPIAALSILAMMSGVSSPATSPGPLPRIAGELKFVENRGQWAPQARFLASSPGLNMWVTDSGITYDFNRFNEAPTVSRPDRAPQRVLPSTASGHVVRVSFDGSKSSARARGSEIRKGLSNYLSQDREISNVPQYDSARVRGIYEGIDLLAYRDAKTGGPRYDIVVQPGADVRQLRVRYDGADNLRVRSGQVAYDTSLGTVVEKGLYAYQVGDDGIATQVEVTPVIRNGAVSYSVPAHDPSKKLVIDPLIYSTFVGGSSYEDVQGNATDGDKNLYVSGTTGSIDFPVSPGAYSETPVSYDAFVMKLNPDGSDIVYSTFVGGNSTEYGYRVAVDAIGCAYLTGQTYSSNFPVSGAFQATNAGNSDAFVVKLNAAGTGLIYGTYIGGAGTDAGFGIALDNGKKAYVVGTTNSTDFPTQNPLQASNGGGQDWFITKLAVNGSTMTYSTYLGGSGNDSATAVDVNALGRAVVVGSTLSSNFPVVNAMDDSYGGSADGIIAQLDAPGANLRFSTYYGGTSDDVPRGVAYDQDSLIYVSGYSYSSELAYDHVFGGFPYGGFVLKLSTTGHSFVYKSIMTYMYSEQIKVDSNKRAYVASNGYNYVTPTPGAFQGNSTGYDASLVRLSPNGSTLTYFTYFGGSETDYGRAVAIDPQNNAYLSGVTYSRDFPVKNGSFDTLFLGYPNGQGYSAKFKLTADAVSWDPVASTFGGLDASLLIRIPETAGPGGVVVNLSGGGGVIQLPPTATIPQGQTSVGLTVHTSGVNVDRYVTIQAKRGSTTAARKVWIKAAVPLTVNMTPSSVVGGSATTVTGRVKLNGKAGPSGVTVYLTPRFLPSSSAAATLPSSVTIPAGGTQATFPITHSAVTTLTTCDVIASAGGVTISGKLKIKP